MRPTTVKVIRRKHNSEIEMGSQIDETNSKKLRIAEQSRELVSIADRVAQDKFHYKNWLYPESHIYFPTMPFMRTVDKMYPRAKGGRLLVDEPRNHTELVACQKKAEVLRPLGYRYLIITPNSKAGETIHDQLQADIEAMNVVG
jgi:hypothetical protein